MASRRRGMHPLLAFFLGFLFALIIIAGAIGGAVIFALNYKLDNISANKNVDDDGNTTYLFINADPENGGVGTIKDLISKMSEISKGYSGMTVAEVENLIPIMSSLTSKLETELSNYVNLEEGELQEVKLGELSAYLSKLVDRINVAKLIGITPDNAILLYMGYGVYGAAEDEDGVWHATYKDENGNEYPVTLTIEDGKVTEASYTDENGETKTAGYLTLDNAAKRVDGVCNDLTIGEIIGEVDEENIILNSIKNSTVNTIADDINKLCIQQILANEVYAPSNETEDYTAKLYKAVDGTPTATTTYKDQDTIYYVEDKDNAGNYVLAGNNGKISGFESGVDYYTLDDGTGDGEIMFDPSYLYYEKDEDTGDFKMVNAGKPDAGRLTSLNGGEYYTYGRTAPLWKLLMYIDGKEQAFTFNNISEMIANVSKNTEHTSMRELDAAGMITFTNKSELETSVTWYEGGVPQHAVLGDMELVKVIEVVISLMNTPVPTP
ncbi:MAG: hypothetical protein K2N22_04135 [Clostridia bacterium]|nr:hypothetical protein [Clostridia bacterium]